MNTYNINDLKCILRDKASEKNLGNGKVEVNGALISDDDNKIVVEAIYRDSIFSGGEKIKVEYQYLSDYTELDVTEIINLLNLEYQKRFFSAESI